MLSVFFSSSRASLPSLSSLTVTVVLGLISSFLKDVSDGSNWSVALVNSTFVFLIGTYEMPSRSCSMVRRFSRKTHKRLRSVFSLIGTYKMSSRSSSLLRRFSRKTHKWSRAVFFLPVSRIVLSSVFRYTFSSRLVFRTLYSLFLLLGRVTNFSVKKF